MTHTHRMNVCIVCIHIHAWLKTSFKVDTVTYSDHPLTPKHPEATGRYLSLIESSRESNQIAGSLPSRLGLGSRSHGKAKGFHQNLVLICNHPSAAVGFACVTTSSTSEGVHVFFGNRRIVKPLLGDIGCGVSSNTVQKRFRLCLVSLERHDFS